MIYFEAVLLKRFTKKKKKTNQLIQRYKRFEAMRELDIRQDEGFKRLRDQIERYILRASSSNRSKQARFAKVHRRQQRDRETGVGEVKRESERASVHWQCVRSRWSWQAWEHDGNDGRRG